LGRPRREKEEKRGRKSPGVRKWRLPRGTKPRAGRSRNEWPHGRRVHVRKEKRIAEDRKECQYGTNEVGQGESIPNHSDKK